MVALLALIVGVPSAQAACSASVRADSRATWNTISAMRTRAAAGTDDAAALYARARRSCLDIRPVRAIVTATDRTGVPTVGQRTRVLGIDLVGIAISDQATAWRLDLPRAAGRSARAVLDAAAVGSTARTWSVDPTSVHWDAVTQAAVVAALAKSSKEEDRAEAARGVRAFGVGSRARNAVKLPLLDLLVVARRLGTGASDAQPAADIARSIALRAFARVRGTPERGWSRIDGAWSSAAQERALVANARALVRRFPHESTAKVVAQLQSQLTTAPIVTLKDLPKAAFYPWPRDGAFDTQQVVVDIDKPADVTLLVYASNGSKIASVAASEVPGTVKREWNGSRADGTIVGAGAYRYNIDARDLANNRTRVPGLEAFTVARDITPPVVNSSTMRVVGRGSNRRAIVSWDVSEPLSPIVRSWLVLTKGSSRASIKLHDSSQKQTVRRVLDLASGEWNATAVFIDGSGNRAKHTLGTFQLR